MPIPGAGWSIVWSPTGDTAYLYDNTGGLVGWWQEGASGSTFDPETTQAIIDQAGGGGVPPEDGGAGGVYGGEVIDDPFWPGAIEFFEDSWEAKVAYSEWQEDFYAQQEADAQAEYEARREEERAYSEAMALASQHMRQEQNWGYAAANAPGAGAGILANLLPGYLPEGIAQALYGYGKEMGVGYDPAWPGGTGLNVAQMTPTGQDWIEYLKRSGYPSYLWER